MRAILFDFNGVLVDDEPIHLELMRKTLAEEGLELGEEEYYARYLGLDDRTCLQRFLEDAGEAATEDRVSRLVTRKSVDYQMRVLRDGYPVFPGAVELIEAASEAGWMLGVVSGALRSEVEGALRQMGVRDRFKTIVSADDVERSKPDPEGYRKGLRELSALPPLPERLLHPHEVLAIEDSPAGLEAARQVGLATLAVAQTYPRDRLAQADRVVSSIAGLEPRRIEALFAG